MTFSMNMEFSLKTLKLRSTLLLGFVGMIELVSDFTFLLYFLFLMIMIYEGSAERCILLKLRKLFMFKIRILKAPRVPSIDGSPVLFFQKHRSFKFLMV